MSRSEKAKLLVLGSLPLVLLAVGLSCSHYLGKWLGGTEQRVTTLIGHRFPVQALAFGPDGTTLTTVAYFTAYPAEAIEVTDWDVRTGQTTVRSAAPVSAFRCLALAPRGRLLAAPQEDGSVWLWDR